VRHTLIMNFILGPNGDSQPNKVKNKVIKY